MSQELLWASSWYHHDASSTLQLIFGGGQWLEVICAKTHRRRRRQRGVPARLPQLAVSTALATDGRRAGAGVATVGGAAAVTVRHGACPNMRVPLSGYMLPAWMGSVRMHHLSSPLPHQSITPVLT